MEFFRLVLVILLFNSIFAYQPPVLPSGEDLANLQVKKNKKISIGGWVGIVVVAVVLFLLVIGSSFWWVGCLKFQNQMERDLKSLDFNIKAFSLRQIKTATNNFSDANKIGEGGFGAVYKGVLTDGTKVAVKQLSKTSKQGNREFMNEIGIISALHHPHLVKLHGCCVEGDQLLLVYEFLENNSLSRALFDTQISLDWPTRQKKCLGIAKGLAYLHEESRLKIFHRDIKASNILLDKNLNPKISDFGLARLDDQDRSHISTTPAGTYGYLGSEYAMKGHLSDKVDVYSFGVLSMEIVYGKSNNSTEHLFFAKWVRRMWEKGKLTEFVDSRLQSYDSEEVLSIVKVAIFCTNNTPDKRPLMSVVVNMLEGTLTVEIDTLLADVTKCALEEEQPPDLMRIMADIDLEFESEEKPETPQTPGIGQTYLLSGKGK